MRNWIHLQNYILYWHLPLQTYRKHGAILKKRLKHYTEYNQGFKMVYFIIYHTGRGHGIQSKQLKCIRNGIAIVPCTHRRCRARVLALQCRQCRQCVVVLTPFLDLFPGGGKSGASCRKQHLCILRVSRSAVARAMHPRRCRRGIAAGHALCCDDAKLNFQRSVEDQ